MFIVAKSAKGYEYLYKGETAHKVAKANAYKICDKLNELGYKLNPGEVWHVHDYGKRYGLMREFHENGIC